MNLKTSDTERQKRALFLTSQTSTYRGRIKKILNSMPYGYTDKQLNELDNLYAIINNIRAELDIYLLSLASKVKGG